MTAMAHLPDQGFRNIAYTKIHKNIIFYKVATTRHNSQQCRGHVERNTYKLVQMLNRSRAYSLHVEEMSNRTRSNSYRCWREIVWMSRKLVAKLVAYLPTFYTARRGDKWRHVYHTSSSSSDTPATCLRYVYETKTRTTTHENFKPFKILAAAWRVLASTGDTKRLLFDIQRHGFESNTTPEELCRVVTRHNSWTKLVTVWQGLN